MENTGPRGWVGRGPWTDHRRRWDDRRGGWMGQRGSGGRGGRGGHQAGDHVGGVVDEVGQHQAPQPLVVLGGTPPAPVTSVPRSLLRPSVPRFLGAVSMLSWERSASSQTVSRASLRGDEDSVPRGDGLRGPARPGGRATAAAAGVGVVHIGPEGGGVEDALRDDGERRKRGGPTAAREPDHVAARKQLYSPPPASHSGAPRLTRTP